MGQLVIGLDLGTTFCKAAAYELDGTLRASATAAIATRRPAPGWAEQDPLDWTAAIQAVLSECAASLGSDARAVAAIGVSSHGPGLIPTDEHFRPLALAPIWQDQRAAGLLPELLERIGCDWVGLGMPESSFVMKLFWAQRNQAETIDRAAYLFDVKGFLLATLTGRVVDESSCSPGGRGWNQATFERLGVDLEKLPETVPSLSVIGPLRPELARAVGLPVHTVVVAGLNDGAAATLGAGVVEQGQGIVSLSTNGVMRTLVPARVPGKTLVGNSFFCYSYANDCFVTGGTTKSGGDSVRWLIDTFLSGYPEDSVYDQIARDASASPLGANGVVFMPYLMGAGSPHSHQEPQGAFLRLGRHH
ncbi:MAG TPA: FGGY family carbohydrate kinase, partial [Anaerolineaceae bacterium]|nr:FGGY family carbohydrate kinase [Anaerolineaceae bacterium]